MFTFQIRNVTCLRVLTDHKLTQAHGHIYIRVAVPYGLRFARVRSETNDLVSFAIRFQLVFRVSVTQFALVLTTG